MSDTTETTRARFEDFFRKRSDDPERVSLVDYQPITGGYSRQMSRVWIDDGGERRAYIVRQDPPPGQAIIDTDRAVEWEVLSTLHRTGRIPMPEPLWFDPTGDELGSPGIVIEMAPAEAILSVARKCDPSELASYAPRMAEVGGALAAFPLDQAPACLEVPSSWDDYIDARIQYWVDAEKKHCDRDPFMRLIGAYLALEPPAARTARPRPRRLPGRQHPRRRGPRQRCHRRLGADPHRRSEGGPGLVHDGQRHPAAGRRRDRRRGVLPALPRGQRAQRGAGQPDDDRLLPAAGVGDRLRRRHRAAGVFEQGETTGIQLAYMSPAVAGMHDVFYRALKRHADASGGGK